MIMCYYNADIDNTLASDMPTIKGQFFKSKGNIIEKDVVINVYFLYILSARFLPIVGI